MALYDDETQVYINWAFALGLTADTANKLAATGIGRRIIKYLKERFLGNAQVEKKEAKEYGILKVRENAGQTKEEERKDTALERSLNVYLNYNRQDYPGKRLTLTWYRDDGRKGMIRNVDAFLKSDGVFYITLDDNVYILYVRDDPYYHIYNPFNRFILRGTEANPPITSISASRGGGEGFVAYRLIRKEGDSTPWLHVFVKKFQLSLDEDTRFIAGSLCPLCQKPKLNLAGQ